jgi:hypothetical protein
MMLTRRFWMTLGRIAVAAAGIAFVCYAIDWTDYTDEQGRLRKGFLSVLGGCDVGLLLIGLGLMGVNYPAATLRWWLLLRARGLHVTLGRTFRLVMAGFFFNYWVPIGSTGGDVVRAYYAARGSASGTDAVMSVIIDRAVGLTGLAVMAGTVGLFMLEHPVVEAIVLSVWIGLAIGAVGLAAYSSAALRRRLRPGRLKRRIPGGAALARLDAALLAYRAHRPTLAAALALALLGHVATAAAVAAAGLSLGIDAPPLLLVSVLPILMLCAMLPLTPQGIGTTEALGVVLLVDAGLGSVNQLVGMLLLWRLMQVVYSLVGAAFVVRGDIHLHPRMPDTLKVPLPLEGEAGRGCENAGNSQGQTDRPAVAAPRNVE